MATHLASLRDKRAKLKADMQAVLRDADGNEGDAAGVLTEEQAAAFARMREALAALEATIAARSDLLEMERRAPASPLAGDAKFAAFARGVTLTDAIAATLGAETRGASMAREASQEISCRLAGCGQHRLRPQRLPWHCWPCPAQSWRSRRTATSGAL